MKNTLPLVLCSTVATLCLASVSASAGFVSPNVPPPDSQAAAQASKPVGFAPQAVLTVTTTADDGPGSLRQAIANALPGDSIDFALTFPATIVISNTLVINKDLTVLGPGPDKLTVKRSDATNTPIFRLLNVDSGLVTINGLTLRNGRAHNNTGTNDNLGGAILNRGMLTVSNCVITHNTAPVTESTNNGFGGGIFSLGFDPPANRRTSLTILNSTISGNEATYAGGGIGTYHSDSFVAEGCTISGNFGGIQGGGVNFQGRLGTIGTIGTIQNCTISGNATLPDGAIFNQIPVQGGSGLLDICFGNEGSMLTLTACTITRNTGTTNGAVAFVALRDNLGQTNRLLSTLVADNHGKNFILVGNPVVQSLGSNLESDGTSGLVNGSNGDIVGSVGSPIDAKLSPLQDNGGPTRTHALLPGSPALGTGSCTNANGSPLLIDQRGFPRPHTTGCDIGAFENQSPTLFCPAAQTLECNFHCGTFGLLTATVADPDGDALIVVWSVDGAPKQTNSVAATHPPAVTEVKFNGKLDLGPHTVSVSVSDGKAATVVCTTTVTVQDTTPPRIFAIFPYPSFLWPPNHKLVPVKIFVLAVDACGCGPVDCKIVSVTSNQPVDNHEPDWVITGKLTLLLRAERSHGERRVYTITVECKDAFGNKSTSRTYVIVPKSQGQHDDHGDDDHHDGDDDHHDKDK